MDARADRLFTRGEVAGRFGVSVETVRRWSRAGLLCPVAVGRRAIRYREADVARLLASGVTRPVAERRGESAS